MTQPVGNKRKLIGALLAVLVLGGVAAVVGYLDYRSTHIITDDAFVQGDIYYVSSQIQGKVAEVLVAENPRVEPGQLLVRLDPSDVEADLTTARRNLEVIKNQVAAQYGQIAVVEAQIQQLRAQQGLLDKDKQRLTNLLRQHSAASGIRPGGHALGGERAQIEAAEKQKDQIETAMGPRADGKEAAVRLAEAQVNRLELMLDHTQVRALVVGYVTSKNVTAGQVVSPGQPLLAVVPLDGLWIEANFKETDLTHVRPGNPVVSMWTLTRGGSSGARSTSIMAGTGAVFSLLPRRTPPATTSRWCSGSRSASAILDGEAKDFPCAWA